MGLVGFDQIIFLICKNASREQPGLILMRFSIANFFIQLTKTICFEKFYTLRYRYCVRGTGGFECLCSRDESRSTFALRNNGAPGIAL